MISFQCSAQDRLLELSFYSFYNGRSFSAGSTSIIIRYMAWARHLIGGGKRDMYACIYDAPSLD